MSSPFAALHAHVQGLQDRRDLLQEQVKKKQDYLLHRIGLNQGTKLIDADVALSYSSIINPRLIKHLSRIDHNTTEGWMQVNEILMETCLPELKLGHASLPPGFLHVLIQFGQCPRSQLSNTALHVMEVGFSSSSLVMTHECLDMLVSSVCTNVSLHLFVCSVAIVLSFTYYVKHPKDNRYTSSPS